jgi:D-alanine transaminase
MRIYLNGRYIAAEDALIPVTDRGFLFGDGIYEVTRASGGELIDSPRHARRFTRNLGELSISLGEHGVSELVNVSRALLQRSPAARHRVRTTSHRPARHPPCSSAPVL